MEYSLTLFFVCTFWKGIITGFDSVLDQSTLATTFQGIHGNCTSTAGIAHMQLVLSVYKSMLTGLTLRGSCGIGFIIVDLGAVFKDNDRGRGRKISKTIRKDFGKNCLRIICQADISNIFIFWRKK